MTLKKNTKRLLLTITIKEILFMFCSRTLLKSQNSIPYIKKKKNKESV